MLATYIDQAMELAVYEIIEDDKLYWGEIPGLQGVWARHATLEGCRRELRFLGGGQFDGQSHRASSAWLSRPCGPSVQPPLR